MDGPRDLGKPRCVVLCLMTGAADHLQELLGPDFRVTNLHEATPPDIIVTDGRERAWPLQVGRVHPGAGLIVSLPREAPIADVVALLDAGVESCVIGGSIEELAAHVMAVDRRRSRID